MLANEMEQRLNECQHQVYRRLRSSGEPNSRIGVWALISWGECLGYTGETANRCTTVGGPAPGSNYAYSKPESLRPS